MSENNKATKKRRRAPEDSSDTKRPKIENEDLSVRDSDDDVEENDKDHKVNESQIDKNGALVKKIKKKKKKNSNSVEVENGQKVESRKDENESILEISKKKKKKNEFNSVSVENGKSVDIKLFDSVSSETMKTREAAEDTSQLLPGSSSGLEIMSDTSFKSLEDKVSKKTLDAISDMGFTHMTEIQARTVPNLLFGGDVLGAAKTGSGKTLAFLIPIVEVLLKLEFKQRNGTGAIIISPTRELSIQTYNTLKLLLKYHTFTHALIIGGESRQDEERKLLKGRNIIVGTPGRLLDHLMNTSFKFKNLMCLVVDEADRLLDIGFETEMRSIIKILPERRLQTMLFSATQTRKTEDLARISLKNVPLYVGVDDNKEAATVQGLKQSFVLCPSEKRFLLLFKFIKSKKDQKVMVFFSSNNSVKFFNCLLNFIDVPVMCLYGKMTQAKRTETFKKFSKAKSATLLCTDVAARGLDIPDVNWVVQFDPPDDCKEYIHRVGRTARGESGIGNALLILRPEEVKFIHYLHRAKVTLQELEWTKDDKWINKMGAQFEHLVANNGVLLRLAKEGYEGYVRAYASHAHKDVFDVAQLNLQKVAPSFCLQKPPAVDLQGSNKKKEEKWKQHGGKANGGKFGNKNKIRNSKQGWGK